jgi:carbohydrate diacid regulator
VYLNTEVSAQIIAELKPFLKYDLNIIDADGLILASTDKRRIGYIHEGAKILIDHSWDRLIVDTDTKYQGCKIGVNLPISFAKEVIGVVGITGTPSETIKYASIIQKMTEMLIYDNFSSSQRNQRETKNLLFINDLISGNFKDSFFNIESYLTKNNLNVHGEFSIAILKIHYDENELNNKVLHSARKTIIRNDFFNLLNSKSILCTSNNEYFITISNLKSEEYYNFLLSVTKDFEIKYRIKFLCAIGNSYPGFLNIPKSYEEANMIIRSYSNKDSGVFCFNNIVLDFILSQIPEVHKINLFNQTFKNCTDDEVKEISQLVLTYCKCNGSINKIASEMFLHKNTVQYRLNKLERITLRDPRNSLDLFVLYMASYFGIKK